MPEAIPYSAPAGEPVADESWMRKPIPTMAPMGETITHKAPIDTSAGSSAALLSGEESEHFRTRWNEIQSKFVDEPRSAGEFQAHLPGNGAVLASYSSTAQAY